MSVVVDRSKQRARTLVEVNWGLPTSVQRKTLHISSIQATATSTANNNEVSPLHRNVVATEFPTPETLARQESWDQDEDIRRKIQELFQTQTRRVPPDHPTAYNSAPETAPYASNPEQNAGIYPFSRNGTLEQEQNIAHGTEWHKEEVTVPIGGWVARQAWSVKTSTGANITENGFVTDRIIIDYFMIMFPLDRLGLIVRLTNATLCQTKKARTTEGEILKFLGILILVTRFESGKKRDLWNKRSRNPYIPAPNFGDKTGMSRDRIFALLSNIKFRKQPQERGDMRSTHFRWALVQDFVDAFNNTSCKPFPLLK